MKIAIRMDDITPDMDWEKFNRFRILCDAFGVKPLLGIVPDCKDPKLHITDDNLQFYDMLKELKAAGWSLAQHACISHQKGRAFSHESQFRNGGTAL